MHKESQPRGAPHEQHAWNGSASPMWKVTRGPLSHITIPHISDLWMKVPSELHGPEVTGGEACRHCCGVDGTGAASMSSGTDVPLQFYGAAPLQGGTGGGEARRGVVGLQVRADWVPCSMCQWRHKIFCRVHDSTVGGWASLTETPPITPCAVDQGLCLGDAVHCPTTPCPWPRKDLGQPPPPSLTLERPTTIEPSPPPGPPSCPPPPPQTKVTTVGKNEIYDGENLMGPFVVHILLSETPPPPSSNVSPPPAPSLLFPWLTQVISFRAGAHIRGEDGSGEEFPAGHVSREVRAPRLDLHRHCLLHPQRLWPLESSPPAPRVQNRAPGVMGCTTATCTASGHTTHASAPCATCGKLCLGLCGASKAHAVTACRRRWGWYHSSSMAPILPCPLPGHCPPGEGEGAGEQVVGACMHVPNEGLGPPHQSVVLLSQDLVKKKKLTAAEQAEAAARFHTQAMETQRKAMEDAAKKCMPHPPRPPRVVRSAGPRLQWKAEGSPGPPPGEGSPARHSGLTPVPPQT